MDWQQYYPTHYFKERDILLQEYESCARNLESQERLFIYAANIILVVAALISSVIVGLSGRQSTEIALILSKELLVSLSAIIVLFSLLAIRYFAERQKSIIFDSRKIVIIRRMLGLDYGNQQLVLPNWRIEGANNPFSIKLFPGWLTHPAYPFWIITLFSSFLIFNLMPKLLHEFEVAYLKNFDTLCVASCVVVVWIIILLISFRTVLYDTNECALLSITKFAAGLLNLKLECDFEYIIYRAKLAVHETGRMGIDVNKSKEILLFIEDRNFYRHKGICIRAMIRALWGIIRSNKRAGGSTITQQLVRTLFIKDMSKTFRRKFIEILLAIWFETTSTKNQILDMYLSSVRFEHKVYGIAAAIKHFLGKELSSKLQLSKAETFFLIERVSNIRSKLLINKIQHTLNQMEKAGIISDIDISEVKNIYKKMVNSELIQVADSAEYIKWINLRTSL